MASDHHSASQRGTAPRYRNISGRPLNRRAVLKAAAGLSATLAAGTAATVAPVRQPVATAQEADGVRAREWVESEQLGVSGVDEGDGWVSFEAEFPFWAVGVGWDAEVGSWPVVELQVSPDGVTYEDIVNLTMRDDGGPSPKDGRVYSDLYFTNGETFIRYRTTDGERNLVDLDRFLITYIDPTDGPWDEDRPQMVMRTASITAQSEDTDVPPSIITRAQWGANENLRFEDGMEIWPPEYAPVEHAIVHHAAVNYGSDGYNAVRSIYYYHAVTQGWGDIGYNYVVDVKGNIFEGRVGGANVIGGHAYEYAVGSSGICVMGDFSYTDAPQAAKASLAYILAYVTRDLDTYATKTFHQRPDLPTICGHRDVVESECPGDYLYDDLPWLRDTVAATLDAGMLDTGNPGGIVPGDRVKVVTEDGGPLNIRQGAGMASSVIGSVENGSYLLVRKGPISDADYNWYEVTDDANTDNKDTSTIVGWVAADFLVVDPPELDLPPDAYAFGTNIQVSGSAYLRSKPSTSGSVIATASNGKWGFIMAGPVDANGYRWYQLRVEGISSDGWMATEGFIIAPVYNPDPKFAVGSQVEATASAAIRVRPGIVQTASGQAAVGERFVVSNAPIAVTDRTWYGVYSASSGGGWIEETQIKAASTSQPSTGGPVTAVNDTFRVTETLNMRSGAGTGNGLVATLPAGATGTVTGGPTSASGYTWWQVRTSYGSGWVVTNWIEKTGTAGSTPPPPTGKFKVNDTFRTSAAVNMRTGAGTNNSIITTLPTNANGTVIGGPKTASGYTWWNVRTSYGNGWVAEDFMVLTGTSTPTEPTPTPTEPAPTPPPSTGKFTTGDGYRVTEALNMRSGAGTSNGIVTTLPAGATGTVIGGPTNASGYTWWQLRTSGGTTGWAVQDWLAKTSSGTPNQPTPTPTEPTPTPAPSTGKFAINSSVRVTETLNMRSGAGTGNGLVATLPAGTTATVLEGPTSASGYTWWRIRTSGGTTGWVAQDWLAAVTASTPAFKSGDSFVVTETLNMRSGAGTGNGLVATLPAGTTGTVTGGPQSASGYTWWSVNTGRGSGWVAQDWIRKA